MTVHLRAGPELEQAEREVAEYERFPGPGVGQVTEVNEATGGARPAAPGSAADEDLSGRGGEKGGSGRRSRRKSPPR